MICVSRVQRSAGSLRYLFVFAAGLLAAALAAPAHAQLASRAAEEWIKTLDSPDRVNSMKIGEMIAALNIKPGQIVADVGAGSGLLSGPLALATGSSGVLYAVDIDKGLLAHIGTRATDQKIANIRTVLGEFTDPKLPAQVDLAFMNDVLHHVADRPTYLKSLASYLKPGGRLAIVDFVPEVSPHRTQPELTVSEAQTETWLQAAGLKLAEKVMMFDDRFYIIYVKP
ncbi:MAG TPA: class I SAM-dependent methyltransferase [Vicinamibacterales bacterium]|nr:class I SAM-dependent methyltransferase [Vicinamibacterales bacterium]